MTRINDFAHATDDHQWIHVDAERAKEGPFAGTVAHGCLTLSLTIPMWADILEVGDVRTILNYGLNAIPRQGPADRRHSRGTPRWADRPASAAQVVFRYLN